MMDGKPFIDTWSPKDAVVRRLRKRLRMDVHPKAPDPCPPWAGRLLNDAKKRAKIKGLECTLRRADMAKLVAVSESKCCLSGLAFDFTKTGKKRRAMAPSLDRIDCSKGYVKGNVRLVVYAVNAAMNEWGFDTLLAVARGVVGKHG